MSKQSTFSETDDEGRNEVLPGDYSLFVIWFVIRSDVYYKPSQQSDDDRRGRSRP
jgi:hypothetical protein